MAHLYERYMTNTTEVEVTDRLIEGLLLTMIKEGHQRPLKTVMIMILEQMLCGQE